MRASSPLGDLSLAARVPVGFVAHRNKGRPYCRFAPDTTGTKPTSAHPSYTRTGGNGVTASYLAAFFSETQKKTPRLARKTRRYFIFYDPHFGRNLTPRLCFADTLLSGSEDEEDDDASTTSTVLKHHTIHSSLPSAPGETNNNSLTHSEISNGIGQVNEVSYFFILL